MLPRRARSKTSVTVRVTSSWRPALVGIGGSTALAMTLSRRDVRLGLGSGRSGAGDGALDELLHVAAGGTIEAERQAIVGGIEHQPRSDEVDAARCDAARQQRRAAHADGGERRLRHDRAVGVDQANIAQAEQHAGTFRRALQDCVVDLHMEVGQLAVDRILDHGDEARQRDRPAGEPAIAADDGDQADDQDPGEDLAADMGAAASRFS